MHIHILEPEKENTYKKGLLLANWAQILKTNKKQSLATISKQEPLTQAMLQGETCTDLPVYIVFLTSEPALIKELLELFFNQYDRNFPHAIGAM